ncbi:DUF6282 family protein [Mycobacteroides abscessus]|uniref:DUF6282 family protein n=1 Tax=Mycobacteroides abscessus TaxID=36809 RepID=UPI00105012B1|nr:DUF6282 family protein [Mycobacteroides abscessus]
MAGFAGLREGEDPAYPQALASALLRGAVSFHDHYGWEKGGGLGAQCRKTYDPVLLASSAREAGMRAVVLRNLYFSSAGDAHLVKRMVPGIDVLGGIFLSSEIGAINPIAVETMLSYGGGIRFLCLATDSSAHTARGSGVAESTIQADPLTYVNPFTADGGVKPEMQRILALIAEHDILLETGYLAPQENLAMVRAAADAGVRRILVTHPTPWFCGMSVPEMQEAIDLGAYIEFTFIWYTHAVSYYGRRYGGNPRPELIGDAFDQIKALGAQHCVLSTDFGTIESALPVEGLRQFIFCLLDLGMTADEIIAMTHTNPAWLLRLDTETTSDVNAPAPVRERV